MKRKRLGQASLFEWKLTLQTKQSHASTPRQKTVYLKCRLPVLHSGCKSNTFPNRVVIYALSLQWESKSKNRNSYNNSRQFWKVIGGLQNITWGGCSLPTPDLDKQILPILTILEHKRCTRISVCTFDSVSWSKDRRNLELYSGLNNLTIKAVV